MIKQMSQYVNNAIHLGKNFFQNNLISLTCETNALETSCTSCEAEAVLHPTP